MKKVALVAALLLVIGMGTAQAGYIATTPTNNNILGQVQGYYAANLYLSGGPTTEVTVEYLGKEAGWTNYFELTYVTGLLTFANTGTDSVLQNVNKGTVDLAPGLVPFRFATPSNSLYSQVLNGSNTDPKLSANVPTFFLTFGTGTNFLGYKDHAESSGQVVIIALDDGGGTPSDDNHDDMVVRLTITDGSFSIPDGGATLMLLGGALLGLGALRRKFRG